MQSERQEIDLLKQLIVSPLPLPENFEEEKSLEDFANELLRKHVKGNLPEKHGGFSLLPHSLLLAHYLHIPPKPKHTTFLSPIIVRKDSVGEYLGAFAHFRKPRPIHLSLIENVIRRKLDGSIFVFSRERFSEKSALAQNHANLSFKNVEKLSFRSIPNKILSGVEPEPIRGSWFLYSDANVRQVIESFEVFQSRDFNKPHTPQYEFCDVDDKRLLNEIFDSYLSEYLRRILPMAKMGNVVFCIPRIYDNQELSDTQIDQLGGGGCAYIVGEDLTLEVVENLFLVSHKICAAAAAVYDISRVAGERKYKEDMRAMISSLHHSIGNTLSKGIPSDPEVFRRILRLEEIQLKALESFIKVDYPTKTLSWSSEGVDKEPISKTIMTAFSNKDFNLVVNDEAIRGGKVDVRLAVVVIELARNLNKRYDEFGISQEEIVISRENGEEDLIGVTVKTKCSYEDAHNIYKSLESKGDEYRGVTLIALVSSGMAKKQGKISWSFTSISNTAEGESESRNVWIENCIVKGPVSIFREEVPEEDDVLEMIFEARSLTAVVEV